MLLLIRTLRFLHILLFLYLSLASTFAQPTAPLPEPYDPSSNLQTIFQQANEFYTQGEMEKALAGYQYLVNLGIKNGRLFYNLGNTYFHLNQLGKSILWYERANHYIPRSDDLHVNLEYARSQTVDEEFREPNYSATVDLLRSIHHYLNLRETLWLTLFCFWLLSLFLFLRLILKKPTLRSWLRIPCWIVGIAFILLFLSSSSKIYQHEFMIHAIIMSSAVDVKTGPNPELSTAFTLHEGTKIRILQRRNNWLRITLPSNSAFSGWLPADSVEVIEFY